MRVTKKQTFSPGLTLPMFVVTVVDWPFCNGDVRFESCGPRVNAVPAAGVRSTCDAASPELFVTLKV